MAELKRHMNVPERVLESVSAKGALTPRLSY
jgi:hypothetical protein